MATSTPLPPAASHPAASASLGRGLSLGASQGYARPRTAAPTAAVSADVGAAAACGPTLPVEERQRRQRLEAEMHRRAGHAAAAGRAFQAALEQRERQRAAVAQEQERQRARWAAAGAARGAACAAAAGASAGCASASAANSAAGTAARAGSSRFWINYALQWRRLYEAEGDLDDCWGRRPGGTAGATRAAASGHAAADPAAAFGASAAAPSDFAAEGPDAGFWRCFAREAERSYRSYRASSAWQQAQQQQAQQQQAQQQWQQQAAPLPAGWQASAAGGDALEQQVRGELTAALVAAGGDLLRFVGACGITFEAVAGDRRGSLRNARAAALMRLHPDKLRLQSERDQLFGLLATQLLNELWMAERARA